MTKFQKTEALMTALNDLLDSTEGDDHDYLEDTASGLAEQFGFIRCEGCRKYVARDCSHHDDFLGCDFCSLCATERAGETKERAELSAWVEASKI